jgi:hypothetical protein
MLWAKNAEFFASLLRDGIVNTTPVPLRPELYEDLEDVFTSFFWLNAGRGFNEVGPQPLPLAEIFSMASDMGLEGREERMEYMRLIRAMDQKYLSISFDQIEKEREKLRNKK